MRSTPPPPGVLLNIEVGLSWLCFSVGLFFIENDLRISILSLTTCSHFFKLCVTPAEVNRTFHGFFFHLLMKSSNQISIDTAGGKESLKVIQLTKYKGDERAKVLPP